MLPYIILMLVLETETTTTTKQRVCTKPVLKGQISCVGNSWGHCVPHCVGTLHPSWFGWPESLRCGLQDCSVGGVMGRREGRQCADQREEPGQRKGAQHSSHHSLLCEHALPRLMELGHKPSYFQEVSCEAMRTSKAEELNSKQACNGVGPGEWLAVFSSSSVSPLADRTGGGDILESQMYYGKLVWRILALPCPPLSQSPGDAHLGTSFLLSILVRSGLIHLYCIIWSWFKLS